MTTVKKHPHGSSSTIFIGDAKANNVEGTEGRDVFRGKGGNDRFDGLGGFDTAQFGKPIDFYGLKWVGHSLRVTDLTGKGGTDKLLDVEQLNFHGKHYKIANRGPLARDDAASGDEGTPVVVAVLGNDFSWDNSRLVIQKLGGGKAHVGDVVAKASTDFGTLKLVLGANKTLVLDAGSALDPLLAHEIFKVDFTYAVKDGSGKTGTAKVAIEIAGTNDPPSEPVDSNASADRVAEGAANGTSVGITAFASDPDGTVTYSLTNDAGGRFAINPTTGVVKVANGALIDFESAPGHAYGITVAASDGTLTRTKNFSIALTDVNAAPSIHSANSASVAENSSASEVAYDANAADDGENTNTITYSLTPGGDNDLFNINATTGEVTFKVSPNFEAPTDAGGNNVYDIVVHANDGTFDTTKAVAITVTDLNDNPPIFSSGATASTVENVATSTTVYDADATDADGTAANSTITYSLTGTDAALFTIDADDGEVRFKASPNGNNVYDIVVHANDGTFDTTKAVAITVIDLNAAPVITSGAAASTTENIATATVVYDANATDDGNTITYSLTSGGDNDLFNINATTGEVTFKVSPDFEAPTDAGGNNVYDIVVHANDGTFDTTKAVAITVTDLNDNPPIFGSGATASTVENVATSTTVYDANATDADGTPANNTVAYSLTSGGDNDLFNIDATTGEVTFKISPDFEAPTDAGGNNVYDIVVHANDGTFDTTQNVAVTVTDLNAAPVITSGASASTTENTATATVVYDTNATDDGENTNTITYSLTSGGDNDLFNINATTGEVTFKVSPNFEAPTDAGGNNVYDIVVHVNDGLTDVTRNVAIEVTNLAPSVPVDTDGGANEVSNGSTAGAQTQIDADSTDPASGTVTYALLDDAGAVADGGGRFAIDPSNGVVTVSGITPILFDSVTPANNIHTITVRASDPSGAFTSQDFTIEVIPNAAPVISSNGGGPAAAVSMNENTTVTGIDVDATDPDNGPITPLVYSIAPTGDGALFAIDPGTGVLTFNSAPNFENPTDSDTNNTYIVTVRASDGAAFDDQIITITVNDAAEAPVIGSNGGGPTASITVNENQTAVTDVDATDPDLPAQTLTYSLVGGTDQAKFNINSGTGVLTFISAPNFESPTDSDTNNTYVVTVRASDGALFDDQTITVTVADVNEQPTLTATGATITYTEDTPSEDHSVTLFTGVAASAVEPGQNLDRLVLTVSNVVDTSERLFIDGSTISLVGGDSVTATNGMSVSVVFTGNTATVTVAKVGGVSAAAMQTLIAGLAYSNTDETPTAGGRVVALVSLRDVGSNLAPSDNVFENIGISTTINVVPTNEPPVANPDAVSATEAGGLNNGTAGVDPTGNVIADVGPGQDTDPDGADVLVVQGVAAGVQAGPLTLNVGTGVSNASNFGTLTVQANGSYTYIVNNLNTTVQGLRTSAQTLTDTFSYTINDGQGGVSTTQVTITIQGQNDNPVAGDDLGISATEAGGTNNGTAGVNPSGNVLTNDNDVDTVANGETETVQGVASGNQGSTVISTGVGGAGIAGSFGTLTVNTNGSFNYVVNNANATVQGLNVGGTLTDTFTYTMRDTALTTDNALVTFTINGANDAPVAVNDGSAATPAYIAFEGSLLTVTLANGIRNNDTDVDNLTSSLTATKDTNPLHGTVTVNADGSFTYTPTPGYLGGDSFTYHVNDPDPPDPSVSLASNSATVFIDVQPRVWHVDNTVTGDPIQDGSAAHPFQSIAAFNAANTAAVPADRPDIIYLHDGTGTYTTTDGVNLFTGQTFLGQGVDLTYTTSASAPGGPQLITLVNLDNTQIPVIQVTGGAGNAGITLAQNNTLAGFTIETTNSAGIGIEDSNAAGVAGSVGTLNVSNVTITGIGQAIDIDQGGTLSATFNSITSGNSSGANAGSTAEGIQLGGIAGSLIGGSFTVTNATSITNADTTAIQVSNTANNAAFDFGQTTVSDSNIGTGRNSNGIDFSTGVGTGNSFTFDDGNGGTTDLNVTTDAGFGLRAGAATANISGTANSIVANGGAAVDLTNTSLGSGATFATVSSANSAGNGIQITGLATGTFTANGGTISNATGTDVSITGGNQNITYNGTITDDLGQLVSVASKTGGTVDFNGAITDGNDGDGSGISLTSNTGATIRFDGGLTLSTGANAAFTATGGGTIVVTDTASTSNVLSTTTGTALNIANTAFGSEGLTFQSISSSGASSGIVLNNTGTAAGNGGLTVTGTGTTDGTGGTIASSTTNGISLTSTKSVNLSNLNVSGSADDGINGSSVNGFTLTNTNITNSGNAVGDRGIQMTQLSGSGGIADSTISGSAEHQVIITNDTANLTAFNVTNTTFSTSNFTTGDDGFQVLNTGSANMTISVTGSTFTDNKGDHFQAATDADATGPMNITFNNNTLSTTAIHDDGLGTDDVIGGGITINTSGSTDITFQINNNNIQQAFDDAININLDPGSQVGASMTGTISGNTIGTSGVQDSGSESSNTVTVAAKGQGVVDIDILNNNIFEWTNAFGIFLQTSEGDADLIAKVTGNTLHTTFPQPFPINGIHLVAGATAGDGGFVELVLTGNDVTGEGNPAAGDADIRLRQRFETTVELPGYGGANNDATAVNAFVAANNDPAGATPAPTVSSLNNVGGGGGGFIGGVATPLLAAQGGVQATNSDTSDADARVLGQVELRLMAAAAIARWEASGLSSDEVATLDGVTFTIADLSGLNLSSFQPGLITIDDDGAGRGWFVDETPLDDSEFGNMFSATRMLTDPTGAPAGHYDLLTTIMHEIGHQLGLEDTYAAADRNELAYGWLVTGERRLADAADVSHTTVAKVDGTGSSGNDVLDASALTATSMALVTNSGDSNDTLTGGDRADVLNGGLGKDSLTGGEGIDQFLFDTILGAKVNVDKITDFSVSVDTIRLDHAIFDSLAVGGLPSDAFFEAKKAHDADDRIIYNDKNGKLFYDADGKGGEHKVLFAKLDKHLELSHDDFLIV